MIIPWHNMISFFKAISLKQIIRLLKNAMGIRMGMEKATQPSYLVFFVRNAVVRLSHTLYYGAKLLSPTMYVYVYVTSQHSAGRLRGRNANTDDVSGGHHVLLLPLLPRLPTSQTQPQSRFIVVIISSSPRLPDISYPNFFVPRCFVP